MKNSILAGILLISLAACSGGWDWSRANPMTWFGGGEEDEVMEPSTDDETSLEDS